MRLLKSRGVKNLIFISRKNELEIVVLPLNNKTGKAWKAAGINANSLVYRLGLAVKTANLTPDNFLLLNQPEFLEEVSFFDGNRYFTYPGIVRRQKIAVVQFPKAKVPDNASEEDKKLVEQFNLRVDEKNARLAEIMQDYPYEWELLDFKSKDDAISHGFQYILNLANSTGENIRMNMNYATDTNETHYISVTPGPLGLNGDPNLKRLAINKTVHKVYIFQANTEDIFVGKEWDADVTWEKALTNFIFTLGRQLE